MGLNSVKIRVELLKAKEAKLIDFEMLKEIKATSIERDERDAEFESELADHDPLFRIYSWMLRLLSDLAEDLSPLPQLNLYYELVEEKSAEYMPKGPPWSPITTSFWNYWVWFDLKYGRDRETIASIILDLGDIIPYPDEFRRLLTLAAASRMGVYEHLGTENDKIQLKELVTDKTMRAICPAGYTGKKGELWLARVFPSPVGDDGYAMVATTPYILTLQGKKEWLQFFERHEINSEDRLFECMKFGLKKKRCYWHDFIVDAYASDEPSHIFLTGIPDIPETLLHNSKSSVSIYKEMGNHP